MDAVIRMTSSGKSTYFTLEKRPVLSQYRVLAESGRKMVVCILSLPVGLSLLL